MAAGRQKSKHNMQDVVARLEREVAEAEAAPESPFKKQRVRERKQTLNRFKKQYT